MRIMALTLACAILGCGNGTGRGPVGADAGVNPSPDLAEPPTRCGDGVCSADESSSTCCVDCGCDHSGQTCQSGQCQDTCGDGVCGLSESSDTCCDDCGCAPGYSCQAGRCDSVCGDGVCNGGENQTNCCSDCGCSTGYECSANSCVSTCGDGVCNGNETSSTCCADCGCPDGYACESNSCAYTGRSTLTWTLTDDCFNGDSLNLKFYDETANLVWPSSTTHYVLSSGSPQTYSLSCTTGNKICYGATDTTTGTYWGVSASGTAACSNCCVYCSSASYSTTLVCN